MAETQKGYCVKCKKTQVMNNPKIVTLKSGMKAAKGPCAKCGCKMCRILGKA